MLNDNTEKSRYFKRERMIRGEIIANVMYGDKIIISD